MAEFNFKYYKGQILIPIIGITVLAVGSFTQFINTTYGVALSTFAVAGVLFVILDKWLWKYIPFRYLYKVKDLSGIYTGTLIYQYIDNMNQLKTDTMYHEKVITQTGSSIVINTKTFDKDKKLSSKSESQIETIETQRDGSHKITYTYFNSGNPELKYAPYFGTEVLHFESIENKMVITGEYYTNRSPIQTRGTINLTQSNKKSNKKKYGKL